METFFGAAALDDEIDQVQKLILEAQRCGVEDLDYLFMRLRQLQQRRSLLNPALRVVTDG